MRRKFRPPLGRRAVWRCAGAARRVGVAGQRAAVHSRAQQSVRHAVRNKRADLSSRQLQTSSGGDAAGERQWLAGCRVALVDERA